MKKEILRLGVFKDDMTKLVDRHIYYKHLKRYNNEQGTRKKD